MDNHVKFARFVLLAVNEEVKTWPLFFSFNV